MILSTFSFGGMTSAPKHRVPSDIDSHGIDMFHTLFDIPQF